MILTEISLKSTFKTKRSNKKEKKKKNITAKKGNQRRCMEAAASPC